MPKTEPGKENSLPGSVCVPLRDGNGDWEVQTDSRFFFDLAGAKKKLGKKKAPEGGFAVCGRRRRLRVLDGAAFLEKAGENFLYYGSTVRGNVNGGAGIFSLFP